MSLENLNSLVKIRQLKLEAFDQQEFNNLLTCAKTRLQDASLSELSEAGQFALAYSAAHTLALAAMRWHGYRSDNRYLVFQCLPDTIGLSNAKWRILSQCHKQRNLAEYEGHLEITEQLLTELFLVSNELVLLLEALKRK